jgi:hypothetical protein
MSWNCLNDTTAVMLSSNKDTDQILALDTTSAIDYLKSLGHGSLRRVEGKKSGKKFFGNTNREEQEAILKLLNFLQEDEEGIRFSLKNKNLVGNAWGVSIHAIGKYIAKANKKGSQLVVRPPIRRRSPFRGPRSPFRGPRWSDGFLTPSLLQRLPSFASSEGTSTTGRPNSPVVDSPVVDPPLVDSPVVVPGPVDPELDFLQKCTQLKKHFMAKSWELSKREEWNGNYGTDYFEFPTEEERNGAEAERLATMAFVEGLTDRVASLTQQIETIESKIKKEKSKAVWMREGSS